MSEDVGDLGARVERALGARPDRDAAVRVAVGDRGVRLDVALVDHRHAVGLLEDEVGLGASPRPRRRARARACWAMLGALVVRLALGGGDAGVGQRLAGVGLGALVGHARRVRLHRLERVDGGRQHLVLDLDQVERLVGDGQLVGGHGGHRLAGEDHAVDRQHGVARASWRLGFSSGMSAAVSTARTPGQRPRRAGVDALDAGVGVRAAQQPGLQQSRAAGRPPTYWVRPVTFSGASKRGMRQRRCRGPRGVVFITVAICSALPQLARRPRGSRPPSWCTRCSGTDCRRCPGGSRPRMGAGFSASSALADMIMPGMQKPHCGTPWLDERLLHRVQRCRSSASPSMVRTSRPRACIASTRQLATGLPSSCTVQAPQSPVPQPSLVPVRPRDVAHRLEQGVVRLNQQLGRLAVDRAAQQHLGHGSVRSVSGGRAARGALERGRAACGGSAPAPGGGDTRPSRAGPRSGWPRRPPGRPPRRSAPGVTASPSRPASAAVARTAPARPRPARCAP